MRTSVFAAISLAAVAAFSSTPAMATDLTLVGTFSGNQCTGSFQTCVARGTTTGSGAITHDGNGSPSIIRLNMDGSFDTNHIFPSINGSELTWSIDGTTLTYTYTPTGDDPVAHYLGLYQGGTALDGTKNEYLLFYDADGISTGTIDLADYYSHETAGSASFSHIDLFDSGVGGVPEPATWAMMLLGIGMIGSGARRRRQKQARALVLS